MIPIIDLQSVCPFAILAGTTITDVPPSVITGDVGLSPATGAALLVTCAEVTGNIYTVDAAGPLPCRITNPALLTQAQLDLQAAITAGFLLAPTMPINTPLTGQTITPGVYPYSAALGITAGTLTFDGPGDYVFKVPTLLTIGVGVTMVLANGADARRIFWVTDTTTINTGDIVKGNFLAQTSISVATLTDVEGKLLAHDGAVTLDQNTVETAGCFACPIITLNVPAAVGSVGVLYSDNVSASGGLAPYVYSITAGTLPDGLVLDVNTGEIAGIPTTVGIFNFSVTATDANGCEGSQAFIIDIGASACPVITITPYQLVVAIRRGAYYQQLFSIGGQSPVTFSVILGALPPGITLNATTGLISGRATERGTFDFTIVATDDNGCSGQRAFSISVFVWRGSCPCP